MTPNKKSLLKTAGLLAGPPLAIAGLLLVAVHTPRLLASPEQDLIYATCLGPRDCRGGLEVVDGQLTQVGITPDPTYSQPEPVRQEDPKRTREDILEERRQTSSSETPENTTEGHLETPGEDVGVKRQPRSESETERSDGKSDNSHPRSGDRRGDHDDRPVTSGEVSTKLRSSHVGPELTVSEIQSMQGPEYTEWHIQPVDLIPSTSSYSSSYERKLPDLEIYRLDSSTGKSHKITLEEASKLMLDTSQTSSDGYTLRSQTINRNKIYNPLNWSLSKGSTYKKVDIVHLEAENLIDFYFIGWIKK